MIYEINETHDPNLRSWVESANDPNSDFPIQNLPFCVFYDNQAAGDTLLGVVIGDQVVDIEKAVSFSLFQGLSSDNFHDYNLRDLTAASTDEQFGNLFSGFRQRLVSILRSDAG